MSQPVLLFKTQDADRNMTVLRVNAAYARSFCEHLTRKGIHFQLAEIVYSEWGIDRNGQRWDIESREVRINGIPHPELLLEGWEIPQVGL
jgi:hypothetical protein